MKIEDYELELKNGEYEEVFKRIESKLEKLIKDVAQEKMVVIDFNWENLENMRAKLDFSYKYSLFQLIYTLLSDFEEKDTRKNKEKLIQELIINYNKLAVNLEKYLKKKEEIKNKDINEIFDNWVKKYQDLFQEMREFKKIKKDALEKDYLIVSYPYYEEIIRDVDNILKAKEIRDNLDNVQTSLEKLPAEVLVIIEDLYLELKNYQDHAFDYEEITLQAGEDYYDVIDKAILKYDTLFQEMLDFLQVSYTSLDDIRDLVYEYYPFYKEHLRSFLLRAESYKTNLKDILDWYNFYQKDYKIDYKKRLDEFLKLSLKEDRNEEEFL